MDIYISYANVVTTLGSGLDMWDSLLSGESGLIPTKDVYHNSASSIKNENGFVGVFKNFNHPNGRLFNLFNLIDNEIMPPEASLCELFIGASSLGDLTGMYKGTPEHFFRDYLKKNISLNTNSFLISNACSSGTDAIGMASLLVKSGTIDIVGVLAFDTLESGKLLQHYTLGTQTRDRARPFDLNRSGTSFGEGAGFIIIANKDGLEKMKKKPLVKIMGFGASCDAFDITAPEKTGRWQSMAIKRAIDNSRLPVSSIQYINAHGSGTLLNDQVEALALKKIFKNKTHEIPISSTKGAIGHTLGATGLIETVFTTWTILHKWCPKNTGLNEKDPSIELYTLDKPKKLNNNSITAMSITFGFGGVNSAIILSSI